MVTLCFLIWKENVATAFWGSQTSGEHLQEKKRKKKICHRNDHSLFPEPENDVGMLVQKRETKQNKIPTHGSVEGYHGD